MTDNLREKYQSIIDAIGEQKVHELYHLIGPQKISIAMLRKMVLKEKIAKSLHSKKPIRHLAQQIGVSHMTIYRQLKVK